MPYPSKRFCDLTEMELDRYENCFAGKLKAVIECFNPDIIHSHHLWIVTAVARRNFPKLPLVTSCHGSELRQFRNCRHIRKRIVDDCRKLDGILALSQIQKSEIENLYGISGGNIHVVGAGYNAELFSPGPKPPPHPVQVAYAGKLSRSKGVPWLLRALSRIEDFHWQLHLIGSGRGPEMVECLELARELKDRVKIYGALPQAKLAKIMKEAHLFVLPSFFEGLPLVLLEALACGCRLVSTALPGVTEVLGSLKSNYIALIEMPRLHGVDRPYKEDEKLFEKNLAEAIKEQIKNVLIEPQIDYGQIKVQIGTFSWRRVFERIQKVYVQVLS